MRVAIFFACLCLLLLGGNRYVFTGTHPNEFSYAPAINTAYRQVIKSINTDQNHITGMDDLETAIKHLISDDIVDEDANNYLVRKYKLLAKYALTCSYVFMLSYLCKSFIAPTPFKVHLTDINITQRILRI